MNKVMRLTGYILATIVLAFCVIMFLAVMNKKSQEDAYVAAMEEFREAVNADPVDVDKVYQLTQETYTEGYYWYVESAAKLYFQEIFVPFFMVRADVQNSTLFSKGITKELIEAEQPYFENSKKIIANIRTNIEFVKTAAETLFSQEAALEYLDEGLDDYYVELYIEQVEEIYTSETMRKRYLEYAETIQRKCDVYEEALNFIIANNGAWHLDGDKLVFKTTNLTNQYNQLLARLEQK